MLNLYGRPTFRLFFLRNSSLQHHPQTTHIRTWPYSPDSQAKMGTFKKEKNRRARDGSSAGGLGNVKTKGENFYR